LPLAVADRRGPPPTSLPGDAVQTFIRREDAERFIDEVRGDDLELASHLRIEARSKHSFHERWASLCVVPNGNRIALRRHLKVNVTLSAVFVGRLFGGPDRLKRITRYQRWPGSCRSTVARRHAHPFLVAVRRRRLVGRVFGADGLQRSRAADTQPWALRSIYVMNADGTA
jgi:hypothetical protein